MSSGFAELKPSVTNPPHTPPHPLHRHTSLLVILQPLSPPPGVYSDTGKLAEVWGKWCRSLRPNGREVFKMTFPQLMPDTFSRGKKKCKWAWPERGDWLFERPVGRGLDFNQGHPAAAAIRAPHTQTDTDTHVFIILHISFHLFAWSLQGLYQ